MFKIAPHLLLIVLFGSLSVWADENVPSPQEPIKKWTDPENKTVYEYLGSGGWYLAKSRCETVEGRRVVNFAVLPTSDRRRNAPRYYEHAAVRLINSPLNYWLKTKIEHANGFAFWHRGTTAIDDSYGYLVYAYEDEKDKARWTYNWKLNELHIVCATTITSVK